VVDVTLGRPWLAPEAIKNVGAWKFADHAPTAFDLRCFYVNQNFKRNQFTKCLAKMDLPEKVTVSKWF
jgi:hypothetical protein